MNYRCHQIIIYPLIILTSVIVCSVSCKKKDDLSTYPASLRLPEKYLPVIAAWFWSEDDLKPEASNHIKQVILKLILSKEQTSLYGRLKMENSKV